MPDLTALRDQWKSIVVLTLMATAIALVISLLQPKEFFSTVTAVPANSALSDKARLLNSNIESLYPEIGTSDELDRVEGAAKTDTVYLQVAQKQKLVSRYGFKENYEGLYKAAMRLKKNISIKRSAYGELKIAVWDKDPTLAAVIANELFVSLNMICQEVNNVNNATILSKIKNQLAQKQQLLDSLNTKISSYEGPDERLKSFPCNGDTVKKTLLRRQLSAEGDLSTLYQEIRNYQALIPQYELALATSIQPLVIVEKARPAVYPDKPRIAETVLFAFGASLLFSILLAVYRQSRNR